MEHFHWDVDPVLAHIGMFELLWYSVVFTLGLLLAMVRLMKAFKSRGFSERHAGTLAWALPAGMLVGAHLVHLAFYNPRAFIDAPMKIFDLGHGLASHGGALGTILVTVWYARRNRVPVHAYLDAVMVASIWVFPWVRIGNFFNSEILGRVTDVPWAVVFDRVDPTHARHPVQLYEAAAGFGLLGLSEWMERKLRGRLRPGTLFYALLGTYFAYRFTIEFWKDKQGIDEGWSLNMGHLLSIAPFVLCAWMVFGPTRSKLFPLLTPSESEFPPPRAAG
ncbi:MAG: prolipoprotein diacylglyceryl transferase [Polyangiales bacterium]|nr:prolipoprotein diacylglyceryl transferase [Myxococcales bacterium]